MSEKGKPDRKIGVFQSHRHFWDNSPGTILHTELGGTPDPLRMRIYDENIKGELTPGMLDLGELIDDITRVYQDRPLLNETYFNVYHLLMLFLGWRLLSAVTNILWGWG